MQSYTLCKKFVRELNRTFLFFKVLCELFVSFLSFAFLLCCCLNAAHTICRSPKRCRKMVCVYDAIEWRKKHEEWKHISLFEKWKLMAANEERKLFTEEEKA